MYYNFYLLAKKNNYNKKCKAHAYAQATSFLTNKMTNNRHKSLGSYIWTYENRI